MMLNNTAAPIAANMGSRGNAPRLAFVAASPGTGEEQLEAVAEEPQGPRPPPTRDQLGQRQPEVDSAVAAARELEVQDGANSPGFRDDVPQLVVAMDELILRGPSRDRVQEFRQLDMPDQPPWFAERQTFGRESVETRLESPELVSQRPH